MTGWESPDTHQMMPLVWSDRNKDSLRGTAKGKRFTPKLRPFDMLSEPNQRLKMFESADVRVIVESVNGTQHFRRNSDFDEVLIQFCGTSHVESEFGKFDLGMGEVLVIPGGVSYRSTGANDCLRMVLNLHEPVFKVFDDKNHTSETSYAMKRTNGPNWSAAPAPTSNAKVIEKLYIWDEDPDDATIIERDYSDLVGVSSIKSRAEHRQEGARVRHFHRDHRQGRGAEDRRVAALPDRQLQHRRRPVGVPPRAPLARSSHCSSRAPATTCRNTSTRLRPGPAT